MNEASDPNDPNAYSCGYPYINLGKPLVGSCAFSSFQATSTTLTATGTNTDGGSTQAQASASIVVGPPIVTGISDSTTGQSCVISNSLCNINIGQKDVLKVSGQGFNPLGGSNFGNNIEMVNQANTNDVSWFFAGEQHNGQNVFFNEGSPSQPLPGEIDVGLDCTVSPTGAWSLIVRDNPGGAPSSPVTLTIVSGGC